MSSQVEICNRALEQVNADPITGFDANPTLDDKSTRLCRRLFPQLRDELLREHVWPFATVRTTLPALATAPAWGYTLQFQLPGDCLRVLRLQSLYAANGSTYGWGAWCDTDSASYDDAFGPSFKVEAGLGANGVPAGQVILADAPAPLAIAYTQQVLDPARFDSLFTGALVLRIAAELAMPITRDASMEQRLSQKVEARLARARAVANLESGDHTRLPLHSLAVRR